MIKNYIKIAVRNIFRQGGYSAINISGLSVSLAVTLVMLLWVQDEWKTDRFHANADQLFRMKRTVPLEGDQIAVYNGVPYPVLRAAVEQIPEVKRYIPLGRSFEETIIYKQQTLRSSGTFGNSALFKSFSFPVLRGDIKTLDSQIDGIAISKQLAINLFGNNWETGAIGEIIQIHDIGEFMISAVYQDFPGHSSIKHDFIYNFEAHLKANKWMLEWTNSGSQGVLELSTGADPVSIAQKIETLFQKHQQGDRKEGILLQPFADHYLYGQFDENGVVSGGRIEYVRTFAIAAFLLLIISCINFVNLSTARASIRAKEVGVRKTIGASFSSLIMQFMTEASLISFISLLLAAMIAKMLLPTASLITEKELSFDLYQPGIWVGMLIIFGLTTLLSGAYPSFILSKFQPVHVLKSKTRQSTGIFSIRKGLVVFQFVLALLLIVSALVVREQIQFVQTKNLGIAKDNLIYIHQDKNITEHYDLLRNTLIKSPHIQDVTVAGPSPINMQASTSGVSWPGKRPDQENIEFQILWTAHNFPEVFDVPIKEGRFYREGSLYDSTTVVFNEEAIRIMGIEDPIGKSISWWGAQRKIIGVVEDFHNRSLYDKIEPAGFLLDVNDAGWMFVKAEEDRMHEAITDLEESFATILPAVPLHFDFVDEQYKEFYKSEELTGTLANYFAGLSIFISCLGLFGLATFYAQQKEKEIGIRKVLGASNFHLIQLLSKQFLLLVFAGLMVGVPIAIYLLGGWLNKFAYKVNLEVWMFAIPILFTLLIATITIGFQSIRATISNPIDSLRID